MRIIIYRSMWTVMLACAFLAGTLSGAQDLKTQMKERLPVIRELKLKGIIGENNKGYLEFIGKTREKENVINAENEDRKEVYAVIAQKQNVSLEMVGQRRALQIAENAVPGDWLQRSDGQWYKKK